MKFFLKGIEVHSLGESQAWAALRVLDRENIKYSKKGTDVYLQSKKALTIVLAF